MVLAGLTAIAFLTRFYKISEPDEVVYVPHARALFNRPPRQYMLTFHCLPITLLFG
jgi:hypothetical protein